MRLPVEVDEVELREDPERPPGQRGRPRCARVPPQRGLERLSLGGLQVPKGPVDLRERGTETVLALVDSQREVYFRVSPGEMDHPARAG